MRRIHLISNPRNLSTALMYSFAQREDTVVVDEPFYAHYLKLRPEVDHPAKKEALASMSSDAKSVVSEVVMADYGPPVLFLKNMAHHLIGLDKGFMMHLTNLFLIRNPKQLIASIGRVMQDPSMEDIGSRQQYDLFGWLQSKGKQPLVLDSGDLLRDQEGVMRCLCRKLKISYEPKMLQWKPGPRTEDGVWAKHWYANVHQSTGFSSQKTSKQPLPDHLMPLYEEAQPYYQSLYKYSMKAGD